MTITLERLVEVARAKATADRQVLSAPELAARLRDVGAFERSPGRLAAALRGEGISVLAEVKGASPVAGQLRDGYDAAVIARQYEAAGASAVSVLTEETYFKGSLQALEEVAAAVAAPVLRKDFIVEAYQIHQAALAGAAAVLLIAEVLAPAELADLVGVAHECGLDAMVEVHRLDSIPAAEQAGGGIIGVNNRNLETMAVDWRYSLEVSAALPTDVVRVTESGISRHSQMEELAAAGYDAALVGSSLMTSDDPSRALRDLLGGAGG